MDLSLLLVTALAANFTVYFQRDAETTQDLFYLSKEDNLAHFYRENNTLTLRIIDGNKTIIYKNETNLNIWRFTWPNLLDNNPMCLTQGEDDSEIHYYDSFTIYNPIIKEVLTQSQEREFNMNDLYFLFLVLPIFLISPKIRELHAKFSNRRDSIPV